MFAKWEYERLLGLCYSLQFLTFAGQSDQLTGLDHSGLYDWLINNFSWDDSSKNWVCRKG